MSAPPVVLLHGWGGAFEATFGRTGWLEALAQAGRTVLPLDLPGHGAAAASHAPQDYGDLASALLQRLPKERPLDAIAFSLGAKLALELACREPGLFQRLVLGGVGNNLFAPEPAGEAIALALEQGAEGDTPQVRSLVRYARLGGSDPLALAAILRRPPNPVAQAARMAGIESRLLLVNGDSDTVARPDDRLRDALGGAGHVVLAGVGHLDLTSQVAFQDAAIQFLAADAGV